MSFVEIVLIAIGLLGFLTLVRMIIGPTIWDRMVCFGVLSSKIVMCIVIFALITGQSYMLDIALLYTLFSYISTVLIARFIRKRGGLL